MVFSNLKEKSLAELYKLLEEKKKDQFGMRVQMRTGQEFKPHKMREVRRDIARILTRVSQVKKERGA